MNKYRDEIARPYWVEIVPLVVLFCLFTSHAFAQGEKTLQVDEMTMKARELMDEGKEDDAIEILKECVKMIPTRTDVRYELGLAYYMKQWYSKAASVFETVIEMEIPMAQAFAMLGNCYDLLGDSSRAIATYKIGLQRFPSSGHLYLELGVMHLKVEDINTALGYFETGIRHAPAHASNYYWAATVFCNTTSSVWGMIYGELFLLLEKETERSEAISLLLYKTYDKEIHIKDNGDLSVSFAPTISINADEYNSAEDVVLPFESIGYERTLALSVAGQAEVTIESLNDIRTKFVQLYFEEELNITYPNILFDYQKKVLDAGHMEAYNYWILRAGNPKLYKRWVEDNEESHKSFLKWLSANKITINSQRKFYRRQYK